MIQIETVDDMYPWVSTDREALVTAQFLLVDAEDPAESIIQATTPTDGTDTRAARRAGIERLTANESSITGTDRVYRAGVTHPKTADGHERQVTVYPHGRSYVVDCGHFRRFTTPNPARLRSSIYRHKQAELWGYGMTTISPPKYRRNPVYRD